MEERTYEEIATAVAETVKEIVNTVRRGKRGQKARIKEICKKNKVNEKHIHRVLGWD